MKVPRRLAAASVALGAVVAASTAHATEVNISATSPSGVDLYLGAGTYDVSEIAAVYVSADLWQDGGVGVDCRTASTCLYGYRPTFDISINGGPEKTYSIPVAKGAYPATFQTAADALAAFEVYQTAHPISFTLKSASTVNFLVPDVSSYCNDSGGISLSVSAAPEPAAWMLTIFGVGGAGLSLRRAKKLPKARLKDGVAA
jgi:hypothetical protein